MIPEEYSACKYIVTRASGVDPVFIAVLNLYQSSTSLYASVSLLIMLLLARFRWPRLGKHRIDKMSLQYHDCQYRKIDYYFYITKLLLNESTTQFSFSDEFCKSLASHKTQKR